MATTVTGYRYTAVAANTLHTITHGLGTLTSPVVVVWCDSADNVNYKQDITASSRIKIASATTITVETTVPVKIIATVAQIAIS